MKLQDDDVSGSNNQMNFRLTNYVMAINRTNTPGRTAALLANALLMDFGIINKGDFSMVIDHSRIKREKEIYNKNLKTNVATDSLRGIYFDGRNDRTFIMKKIGRKYYRREIVEQHVSILEEPDERYIGHVTPAGKCAVDLAQSLSDFLNINEIDQTKISKI